MDDFAPGLPSKIEYGDLSRLKPGQIVDLIIQHHKAERAGPHYDVRFGDPATGLFSWATKKELPKAGGKIALFQQPLHRHAYKEFEGEITKGYGKGTVKKQEEGTLLITKISPTSIQFTKTHKKHPERFALVKPKKAEDRRWLLINVTPTEPIPHKKIHYASISQDKAEQVLKNLQPGTSVQAKIDGAASLTKLMDDKLEIISYRTAKETGHPIIHTERIFKGPVTVSIPKKYAGSILRGELYGERKSGEVIPPQELGGILNSSIFKAMATQKERGIELKNQLFDVQQLGKKSVTGLPYSERMKLLKEVVKYLPSDKFNLPEEAKTPKAALKLLKDIKEGKHALTREGVVIHKEHGKPTKVKFTEEHDVHITGLFPGEGKYHTKGVGGFTYSLKPGGKTVGKVGTGFSDELRKDMFKNPEDYIGRVAKIRAQEQHSSGAFRAPALLALHEDYPTKEAMAGGLVDELINIAKEHYVLA